MTQKHLTVHSYCVELGILFLLLSLHLISLYSWEALQRHNTALAVKAHGKPHLGVKMLQQCAGEAAAALTHIGWCR